MSKLDYRNRTPSVERLPDYRLRVTRQADLVNYAVFTTAEATAIVWLPWGTADETYPECRLIKQEITGQHPARQGQRGDPTTTPLRHPALLTQVFEQIDASAETSVGNADVQIDQDGRTTVTQEYIQFSTGTAIYGVPGVTAAPAPWASTILKSETRTDDGDLRHIKRVFIDAGLIEQSDEIHHNGALLIRHLTYINQIPPTPSGWALFNKRVNYPAGLPVYTYSFALGVGVIDKRIQRRTDGLTLETWISLGTSFDIASMQPSGVPLAKDQEWMDGYYKFMASSMQGIVAGTSLFYVTKHPFRYPGRAKTYRRDTVFPASHDITLHVVDTYTASAYDVFLSPPIDVEVDATVTLSYGTAAMNLALGTAQFWNPDNWATLEAVWQGWHVSPQQQTKTLQGFRAVNSGVPLNFTAGSAFGLPTGTVDVTNVNTSCLGQAVGGLSSGYIVVYGGPPAPDNFVWTLAVSWEPAFTDFNNVQYYRKTQVEARIPAQSALPV